MVKNEIQDKQKREFIKNGLLAIGVGGAAALLSKVDFVSADRRLNTVSSTSDATINGIKVGLGGGSVATNTAVGLSALAANTTGTGNTALGYQALAVNQSGTQNTAVGTYSLAASNTSGAVSNTALGFDCGQIISSGAQNVAIGAVTLKSCTTGSRNIAVGFNALYFNTVSENVAIGS